MQKDCKAPDSCFTEKSISGRQEDRHFHNSSNTLSGSCSVGTASGPDRSSVKVWLAFARLSRRSARLGGYGKAPAADPFSFPSSPRIESHASDWGGTEDWFNAVRRDNSAWGDWNGGQDWRTRASTSTSSALVAIPQKMRKRRLVRVCHSVSRCSQLSISCRTVSSLLPSSSTRCLPAFMRWSSASAFSICSSNPLRSLICFRISWSNPAVSRSKLLRSVEAESDSSWKDEMVELSAVIFSSRL